jgi:hypothetical protein
LWMFGTDSFSATRNSTTNHCLKFSHYAMQFWWPPPCVCVCARACVQANVLFCCPAVARRMSKIDRRKNLRYFLLILTSLESVAKLFGQPSYYIRHFRRIFT